MVIRPATPPAAQRPALGLALLACMLIIAASRITAAQISAPPVDRPAPKAEQPAPDFAAFTKMLKNAAMVGTFTIDGDQRQARRAERYEISKVVKQPKGDYWLFFARIAYGDHDVTLPVPVQVKWAAQTPVITVDNLTLPGLGTFDARVLIADGKYAGTWRHGKVGGLMFGRVESNKPKADAAEGDAQPNTTPESGTTPAAGAAQRN